MASRTDKIAFGVLLIALILFVVLETKGKDLGDANPGKINIRPGDRAKYDSLSHLGTFLVNPVRLASSDQPDSFKGMDLELLKRLESLSHELGVKLKINSGFRTPAHNAAVGGVKNSAHLTNKAVDIAQVQGKTLLQMAKAARKVGFQRIGVGGTFIHVDADYSRPHPATWGKDTYPASQYTKEQLKKELKI